MKIDTITADLVIKPKLKISLWQAIKFRMAKIPIKDYIVVEDTVPQKGSKFDQYDSGYQPRNLVDPRTSAKYYGID